jgi:2,4-dienoyl-CoA reductase-like NADH-dependent reductase (Old Yellow Enzyme family)
MCGAASLCTDVRLVVPQNARSDIRDSPRLVEENGTLRVADSLDREGYFRSWCKEIKSLVNVPVMVVGGLRTFELMEQVVQNGEANFISLSRPLIREPSIVNDWKSSNYHRATCISCNKCF